MLIFHPKMPPRVSAALGYGLVTGVQQLKPPCCHLRVPKRADFTPKSPRDAAAEATAGIARKGAQKAKRGRSQGFWVAAEQGDGKALACLSVPSRPRVQGWHRAGRVGVALCFA